MFSPFQRKKYFMYIYSPLIHWLVLIRMMKKRRYKVHTIRITFICFSWYSVCFSVFLNGATLSHRFFFLSICVTINLLSLNHFYLNIHMTTRICDAGRAYVFLWCRLHLLWSIFGKAQKMWPFFIFCSRSHDTENIYVKETWEDLKKGKCMSWSTLFT